MDCVSLTQSMDAYGIIFPGRNRNCSWFDDFSAMYFYFVSSIFDLFFFTVYGFLCCSAMAVPCPGGMGLLTVVMVSGSVVLLVLGSQKLLEPKSRSPTKRSCLISSGYRCDRKTKRVRFAADVVEPRGNNEKYRRRGHSLAPNIGRRPATAPDFQTSIKRSLSLFPAAKSTVKSDAEDGDVQRESCVGRPRPVQERRIQTVTNSNIPANRRVLYNGLLQYSRMQRASVYWLEKQL